MTVVTLCLSPSKSAAMRVVEQIEVIAGCGIVGDRYFGAKQNYPGQNLTLIEAEEVDDFNARVGRQLLPTEPRRNVVTRGIRLNELVGATFTVGSATLRGVELCEPCGTLAGYLSGAGMSKAAFVREFAHRCGLRADVVVSGIIRVGDQIAPPGFGATVLE